MLNPVRYNVPMRFLQMLIASLFAFFVTRIIGAAVAPAEGDARRVEPTPPRRLMVRCASCGVYVLRERALPASGGAYLCSASCGRGR
jgi:hypothetical protein